MTSITDLGLDWSEARDRISHEVNLLETCYFNYGLKAFSENIPYVRIITSHITFLESNLDNVSDNEQLKAEELLQTLASIKQSLLDSKSSQAEEDSMMVVKREPFFVWQATPDLLESMVAAAHISEPTWQDRQLPVSIYDNWTYSNHRFVGYGEPQARHRVKIRHSGLPEGIDTRLVLEVDDNQLSNQELRAIFSLSKGIVADLILNGETYTPHNDNVYKVLDLLGLNDFRPTQLLTYIHNSNLGKTQINQLKGITTVLSHMSRDNPRDVFHLPEPKEETLLYKVFHPLQQVLRR